MKSFNIFIERSLDNREMVDTVSAKGMDDAFNKWASSRNSTMHGFHSGGRKGRDPFFTAQFNGANNRVYSRRVYVCEVKDQA